MDSSTETTQTDAEPLRAWWRRMPSGKTMVLAVSVVALVAAFQGFSGQRSPKDASEETQARGTHVTSTVVENETEIADGFGQAPVVPPVLPDEEPLEVREPASRAQVDPGATNEDASPSPSETDPVVETSDLDLTPVTTQQPRIKLEQAAAPAPTVSVRGVLDEVRTPAPKIELPSDAVAQALEIEGVTFATSVDVSEMEVTSDKGIEPLRVAAVDPGGFRMLTPQVTADADGVWQRIDEGDAAFTHDVGARLDLELGSRIPAGDEEGSTIRIGAYASNGVPPIADVVVSRATAASLGLRGTRTLLVSIAEDADADAVAAELSKVTGMKSEVIAQPETRRAFLTGAAARDAFEPFSYVSIGDGMIQIEQDWVRKNIETATVPVFTGAVHCHRLFIPQLRGALEEVVEAGLDKHIDPTQYGGCYVPRHILFNPSRPLSMHAWGLAIDFNVRGNEYGNRNPEMHPGIVEIFERWGFVWGGRWSTPDGMHFELGALMQDGEGG